ncbi:MAG: hypothetical protein DRQ54_10205 [Gammaproteobacteria bacterium]|nr:MAG: hypothetical protein DRQ54_10205 [Gammaproteobacteria bacterium]
MESSIVWKLKQKISEWNGKLGLLHVAVFRGYWGYFGRIPLKFYTMFKNKSVYIAKVEHASRLLPGDGKRAGRSFYFRPASFHKWYY